MAQEPAPPPPGTGKPGFFQSMNGVIAGITGLVIALGSLAAAWNSIFPKDRQGQEQPTANSEAETAAAAAADDSAATDEAAPVKAAKYSGNLYADKEYGGDAVTLEDNGEYWLLTVGDNDPVYYEEVKSPYSDWVMAYDKDEEKYLNWPMDGGELQKGNRDKDSWRKYAWVEPEQPAADESAAEEPAQPE